MELIELDIAIILTIYTRGNRSKKAHFPIEFIRKGFPSHLHGKIKKRVEKLRRAEYVCGVCLIKAASFRHELWIV